MEASLKATPSLHAFSIDQPLFTETHFRACLSNGFMSIIGSYSFTLRHVCAFPNNGRRVKNTITVPENVSFIRLTRQKIKSVCLCICEWVSMEYHADEHLRHLIESGAGKVTSIISSAFRESGHSGWAFIFLRASA